MLRGPWSLRRRLVLGTTALLAVVVIVIGLVTIAVLRANLVGRLDDQVRSAAKQFYAGGQGEPNGGGGQPDAQGFLPGQGRGAIRMNVAGSQVVQAGYVDENSDVQTLTVAQQRTLLSLPFDGQPHTVSLGKLGEYRVYANSRDGQFIVIAGLPMSEVDATTSQLVVIVAVVSVLALVLAAMLGLVVVGVALRPLTRVAATATRVSELQLEAGPVDVRERVPDQDAVSSTEVGRVGASLNRLLDRVQSALTARTASEDKLRRFVADASHELRTPLASIRGYAELSSRFGGELPPDVQRSLDRIGSESIRMTALVEDLLLLARLDSGAELHREPVDLARLLVDAVSDAHVAAPDHEWVIGELPGDVSVLGDGDRLHQVVANLLANARTHTPAGTAVTVGLRTDGDDAVIEVEDDGPGIPDGIRDSLFERFTRGDSSRNRNAGSTGLGLSIARAIVDAHEGRIGVESEPGRTVFRVTLPLDPYLAGA